jgi:hypothetical protein
LTKASIGAIAVLACLAVLPTSASAAFTFFASPGGFGTECSASTPCTVEQALALSASGDTVVLTGDKGTYGTPGSPIVPELLVPNGVVVEGAAGQPMPQLYSHGASAGIRLGTGGTLSNVAIHEEMTGEAVVSQGTISQVLALATSGAGCRVDSPGTTIVNTVCAGKFGLFDVLPTGFGTGAWPLTLRNDTIYGTAEAGMLAVSEAPNLQITAINIIVRGALTTDIETGQSGAGTVDVNLSHSNYAELTTTLGTTTVTPPGSGTNQTAAPIFVNAAANDFAEQQSSPTIDAGVNEAANGPFDVLGNPRTSNVRGACTATTDIGAYELSTGLVVDCFGPPPKKEGSKKVKSKSRPAISALRAKIRKRKATFHFEGTGVGFECKLDKKPFRPCRSPKTYKHLKAGKHEFSVRAVDAKGKHSKAAKRAFRTKASRHR